MPTIIPEDFAATARVLIDLADRPRDVQTTSEHFSLALVVPDYLYERWQQYKSLEASSPEVPKKGVKK